MQESHIILPPGNGIDGDNDKILIKEQEIVPANAKIQHIGDNHDNSRVPHNNKFIVSSDESSIRAVVENKHK